MLIEHAIVELSSDFETLVADEPAARAFVTRLRSEVQRPAGAHNWYSLRASRPEVMIVRQSLLNLGGGPPTEPPPWLSKVDLDDLFREIDAQLGSRG